MVQERVTKALAKGMLALLDIHLKLSSAESHTKTMEAARSELIQAVGDAEPRDMVDSFSKLEIANRVAREMREMHDKYPLGAVILIIRFNRHEHMTFLYPEDQNIKGIAVMNEWAERNRVFNHAYGYFVLTPDGCISWLPGACVMSR